jgi:hypothetical protein
MAKPGASAGSDGSFCKGLCCSTHFSIDKRCCHCRPSFLLAAKGMADQPQAPAGTTALVLELGFKV